MTVALAIALLLVAANLAARYLDHARGGKDAFAWHRQFQRDGDGAVYMDRWQLIRSPWVDVYINRINTPDDDPYPHNHPWRRAWSFKLYGGYTEEIRWGSGLWASWNRTPKWFSRIPDVHRIVALTNDRPCWTLFVGVQRRRVWGFFDHAGKFIRHDHRAAQRAPETMRSVQ